MIEVIIPTYKPGSYLYECLLSIDKQNISLEHFRVTIVLNGPKDPFFFMIKKWLDRFSFSSDLLYISVASVSLARNYALDRSQASYVCFLDDDDIISANYLASLSNLADGKSLVVANTKNFSEIIDSFTNDYLTFNSRFSSNDIVKYRKYLSNSCGKLIPTCLINDVRFNEKLKNSEDAVFMFELSKNIEDIISSDINVIYYRRLRENSASRRKVSIKDSFCAVIRILYCFTKIYFNNPFKYNFFLYLTRLAAVFKRLLLTLK